MNSIFRELSEVPSCKALPVQPERAAEEQAAGHSDPPCPSTRTWFWGSVLGRLRGGWRRVRAGNNGGYPNS